MKSTSVILALICITALLDITVGDYEVPDCSDDPSMCSDLQCCVNDLNNHVYACKNLSREGEECYFDYDADEIRTVNYIVICPCMKNLTCVENEDESDDRDNSRYPTCQRADNDGLITDLLENFFGMQNETKPILPLDKKEKE